jgi:hypothetical protein
MAQPEAALSGGGVSHGVAVSLQWLSAMEGQRRYFNANENEFQVSGRVFAFFARLRQHGKKEAWPPFFRARDDIPRRHNPRCIRT